MKLGLFLGTQHPGGDDPAQRVAEHVEQVRLIAGAGYDAVWLGQHYVSYPNQYLQPVPLLGRLAADARDMWLGTNLLLLPMQRPVEVAEQFATLDAITGGKVILGVGLGYREEEFAALGVPIKTRVGRMEEGIEIIKRLWTEDDVTFEGKYYRLSHVSIRPRPIQQPRIPIWIGATADPAVRRAAMYGDAWIASNVSDLHTVKAQAEMYEKVRAEAGLPPAEEFARCVDMYVAPTREQAWREGGPFIAAKYRSYHAWGMGGNLPREAPLDVALDKLAEDRFIIGDPEDCVREFKRHRDDLGVTHLIVRVQFPGMTQRQVLDALSLLAERVIPELR